MAAFPQELFEAIIDSVEDEKTLCSCALVAHNFLVQSQRNLFHTLVIYNQHLLRHSTQPRGDVKRRTLAAAGAKFETSSHLGLYVRDLSVQLSRQPREANALETIFGAVSNVGRLAISGGGIPWTIVPHGVTQAVHGALWLPSLQYLHLIGIDRVPCSLVAAALVVPVVSFHSIRMDDNEEQDDYDGAHRSSPTPRLRYLMLQDASPEGKLKMFHIFDFLLHPRNAPYTGGIRNLELRLDSNYLGRDQELLRVCAPNLGRLFVNPIDLRQAIVFPQLPRLRHISFRIDPHIALPAYFSTTIENLIPAVPRVETITLRFVSTQPSPLHVYAAASHPTQFPSFDTSFAARNRLPFLRRVKCILVLQLKADLLSLGDGVLADFVATMEGMFPGPKAANMLVCSLKDSPSARHIDRLP
ncbi:hypothetical protein C8F01DRAFT_1291044 [Mycena amicta]|nr:hypothetical protein C8F01DRAFT_1291044 [Mycena amicta]